MYSSYIARQPIFNRQQQTVAYELLYRQSNINQYPGVNSDDATRSILADILLGQSRRLLNHTQAYVNFSHQAIIEGLPTCFGPDDLVIEILEGDAPSADLVEAIKELHSKGYTLALDDFVPSREWACVLPYIAIVKIDIQQYCLSMAREFIESHQHLNLQFVAEKIENKAELKKAMDAGFDLFQGYYLCRPELMKKKVMHDKYPSLYEDLYYHLSHPIQPRNPFLQQIEDEISLKYAKLTHYLRKELLIFLRDYSAQNPVYATNLL